MNDDGTFRSAEIWKGTLSRQRDYTRQTIIPYCAFGGRTSHTWLVLKYLLGYPEVQHYAGGWVEWSKQPDAIIA
jgi:thiosulfate/3-mercaptopyruvate sulfurtransferase